LAEKPPRPLWQRFLRQFQSPLIYILLFALVVDVVMFILEGAAGFPAESLAISSILLLNAGLGTYQESKSEAALTRLKAMSAPLVWVRRDGQLVRLQSAELVPGDVVRVEAGDRVPADGVLLEGAGVMVNESVLTGESVPVDKEKGGEILSGTLLVCGKGYEEVSRTGASSAMGRLAAMLSGIEAGPTPLEQRLGVAGRQIAIVILVMSILLVIGGLFVEGVERLGHVLMFAVALAVAAIPEGLPAVLTLTLTLGVERMAKRRAIVRRLSAVEALGSVTVIATDKTGTLTENRMQVRDVDSPDLGRALQAMVLANDAEDKSEAGDPLELALLDYARTRGHNPTSLRQSFPRKSSLPFDSSYKYMRATVIEGASQVSYLKGAPEVLLQRSRLSENDQRNWAEKAEAYARDGFRVLALAGREGEGDEDLTFLGLALLWDPPRPEVPGAIREALAAGIRVIMVTGDHPATALAVAHEVGIPPSRVLTGHDLETLSAQALREASRETNVFARVSPENKLRLVEALRQNGEIVAMTGDGVNDAPALKRANVGVAMGQRGSDVSREVADLVLMDDNFATIIAAIEEGRSIYENILKFNRFLFSVNMALVLLVLGGTVGSFMMGLTDEAGRLLLPLTAVQLLWINVIANGPPALALGLDRNPGVMRQPPRDPQAPLLDATSVRFILFVGSIKAMIGCALLLFFPKLGFSIGVTRTAVFLFESVAPLAFTYPTRRINYQPLVNPALHLAVVSGVGIQMLAVFLPSLRSLLGLYPLNQSALAALAATVLLSWGTAEIYASFSRAGARIIQ